MGITVTIKDNHSRDIKRNFAMRRASIASSSREDQRREGGNRKVFNVGTVGLKMTNTRIESRSVRIISS